MNSSFATPIQLGVTNPILIDERSGPWANIAAFEAAVPVGLRCQYLSVFITGTGEMWYPTTTVTNGNLVAKTSSAAIAKVRNVYLVADAADQTTLGGTANNVYVTAQAAWDAAVTIATANAAYQVVINVGSITAAIAGTLTTTLTATTSRISWVGMGRAQSIIGNCNHTYTAATTFRMYNMTAGTQSFTTSGNFGLTLTCENSTFGNTTYSYTGTALATNPSFTFQNCINLTVGTISLSSTNAPTTNSGSLNFLFCSGCSVGAITLVNYSIIMAAGAAGNIYNAISSITTNGSSTVNITINVTNCVLGNVGVFYNTTNAIIRNITFTNCSFAIFSISGSGTMAGTNNVTLVNCNFSSTVSGSSGQLDNVNFRFRNCNFNAGLNGLINNMIFHNCFINQGGTAIAISSATITGVEFWLCSIYSTGGTNWINVTTGTASIKFNSSGSFANLPAGAGITLT